MSRQSSSPSDRVGPLAEAIREVQLWWRLLFDSRVPGWTKLIPLFTLLYIIFPLDLIMDPILGLGQLDDLAVLLLGMELFVTLAPAAVVAELRRRIRSGEPAAQARGGSQAKAPPTVDATYRVVHDDSEEIGPGASAPVRNDDKRG